MATVAVGGGLSEAAVGSHTREPPKPNHPPFRSVGNRMKLFENLADHNLVNRGNDGVIPGRVQRGDSYVTYGGGGGDRSVGGDRGIDMAGRRRGGDDNHYCRMGGGGGKV